MSNTKIHPLRPLYMGEIVAGRSQNGEKLKYGRVPENVRPSSGQALYRLGVEASSGIIESLLSTQVFSFKSVSLESVQTSDMSSDSGQIIPETTMHTHIPGGTKRGNSASTQTGKELYYGRVAPAELVQAVHEMLSAAGVNVDMEAQTLLRTNLTLREQLQDSQAALLFEQVGNELGAGKPYKARLAAMVALSCAFLIGIMNVIWTVIFRQKWGEIFTPDTAVTGLVASVMPIMGLCELGNWSQTTGCGILRGTARPAVGARNNLGSFYFVGTPVALGLAFWFKVGFGGLWYGLLSAQVACAVWVLYAVLGCTDWEAESLKARKLAGGVEMGQSCINNCNGVNEDEEKRFLEIEKLERDNMNNLLS